MKKRGSLVAAALLCALAAFAAMTFGSRPLRAAHATPTSATGCARADVMKTVFPKAGTVGLQHPLAHKGRARSVVPRMRQI